MDGVTASLQVEANCSREFAVVFNKENETAAWPRIILIQHARRKMIVHRSGAILCFACITYQFGFHDEYAIEFAISHGRKLMN